MTQTFSQEDFVELSYSQPVQDNSFETYKIPECLGEGYFQEIELFPGLDLAIYDNEYRNDLVVKSPVRDHPVQFCIFLSSVVHHEDFSSIGGKYGYLSGNGIAQAVTAKYQKSQRQVGISVHLEPEVLETFLAEPEQSPTHLNQLIYNNDWQVVFSPQITLGMQVATQRIINSPFQGVTKRLYLQGKILELLAMILEAISSDRDPNPKLPRFKPETIARLHHAREILATQLENPPLLSELAVLVGVSDRTLQRGFRELFGTTVVGYLTHQRMKRAEQLLRQQNRTVAEIARMVGYAHLGHFAAAFKRQFGITPRECLVGKKAVLGS